MIRSNRILFVIAKQHLKIAGGIGNFYRGLNDQQEELDCWLDLAMDNTPDHPVENNLYLPDKAISYSSHRSIFSFSDSINAEMVLNFRDAIFNALKANTYTHIILNTPEAVIAAQYLGIEHTRILNYTHQESFTVEAPNHLKNPTFAPQYLDLIRNLNFVEIGVQTNHIKNCIQKFCHNTVHVLPFFYPKDEMQENTVPRLDRKGVLFVGRWEDRKQPKVYLDMIKRTGLPAKVMTNETGKKKFEAAFKEAGITDYEIKYNIVGKEKIDFICNSRLAFLPYKLECCPYVVFETMTRIPTIIPLNNNWYSNFDEYDVLRVDLGRAENCRNVIHRTYEDNKSKPESIIDLNNKAIEIWKEFLNPIKQTLSISGMKNHTGDVVRSGQVSLSDIKEGKVFSIETVNQINRLMLCRDVNIGFTQTETLYSTLPLVEPIEEDITLGAFFA